MSEQTTRTPAAEQDFAGTPRPDAMLPALDAGQLEALRQVGREWDHTSAGPRVWQQALPVDPALGEALGEDPKARECRPARFTRLLPVARPRRALWNRQEGRARNVSLSSITGLSSRTIVALWAGSLPARCPIEPVISGSMLHGAGLPGWLTGVRRDGWDW
jgi:hypothetical protein